MTAEDSGVAVMVYRGSGVVAMTAGFRGMVLIFCLVPWISLFTFALDFCYDGLFCGFDLLPVLWITLKAAFGSG